MQALHRLEERALVATEWGTTENARRAKYQVTSIRRAIAAADPELPLIGVVPVTTVIRDTIRDQRLVATVATAFGLLAGIPLSLAAARVLGPQLHGVSATDLVSFAVAAGSLVVCALLAAFVPATRATRISPAAALAARE